MLKLYAALIAAVLLTAQTPIQAAPSQPPIPSTAKGNGNNQGVGNTDGKKTTQKQGSSKDTPLFVKVVTAPDSDKQAADIAKDANKEAANNDISLDIEIALAIFAALTWVAIAYQAILTRSQIELARDEFLAANPAHLVMRNVTSRKANPGDEIAVSFDLINVGRANARIVASTFRIDFVEQSETFHDLTLPAVGEPPRNIIGPMVIQPAAVLRKTVSFRPQKWKSEHFHNHGIAEAGFFFSAKILYRDPKKNQRRLGVMRRLALPSRRFRPVNDPEFEYDD